DAHGHRRPGDVEDAQGLERRAVVLDEWDLRRRLALLGLSCAEVEGPVLDLVVGLGVLRRRPGGGKLVGARGQPAEGVRRGAGAEVTEAVVVLEAAGQGGPGAGLLVRTVAVVDDDWR